MAAIVSGISYLITNAPTITSSNFVTGLNWLNDVIAFCKNDTTTVKNKTFPSIIDDASNYAFKVDINKTGTDDIAMFNNYISHIKAQLQGISDNTDT